MYGRAGDMAGTPVERWIGVGEAARRLAVSPEYARRLCDRGALRSIRTPLGRLVDPVAVDQLAEARRKAKGVRA